MDINAEEWQEWEIEFQALAQQAQKVTHAPNIGSSQHFLCLYGENGLSPQEELAELKAMAKHLSQLQKVEVETAYWQDIVLFVPAKPTANSGT